MNEIKQKLKKGKIQFGFGVAVAIICGVFIFFGGGSVVVFALGGILLVVVGGGLIAIGSMNIRNANKQILDLISNKIKELYPNVQHYPNQGLSMKDVFSGGLIVKRPDRSSSSDLLRGSNDDYSFSVSDVELEEEHETTDKDGNTHYYYETYFKGRYYIYNLNQPFEGALKILEKNALAASKNGLEKIETESIAFTKKFKVFTSSDVFTFKFLTPQVIEGIEKIEELHKGSVSIAVFGSQVHLAINDSKDYLSANISDFTMEAIEEKIKKEIGIIFVIAKLLNFDYSKYDK